MLFLLNDVVFDLDAACPVTAADARRFERLDIDYVIELGGGVTTDHLSGKVARWADIISAFMTSFTAGQGAC